MRVDAIANFWVRFEVVVKNRGYKSMKEFIEDVEIGIAYPTLLTKRSKNLLPEVHTLMAIAEELDVSVDYLLFGYVSEEHRLTGDEIELLRRYQKADKHEKNAIKAILGMK